MTDRELEEDYLVAKIKGEVKKKLTPAARAHILNRSSGLSNPSKEEGMDTLDGDHPIIMYLLKDFLGDKFRDETREEWNKRRQE